MTNATSPINPSRPVADPSGSMIAPLVSNAGGWQEIVARVSAYVTSPPANGQSPQRTLEHLTGLLRLQVDVTQYQMRVEVVSKVAESAVASLRKLQQSQ